MVSHCLLRSQFSQRLALNASDALTIRLIPELEQLEQLEQLEESACAECEQCKHSLAHSRDGTHYLSTQDC